MHNGRRNHCQGLFDIISIDVFGVDPEAFSLVVAPLYCSGELFPYLRIVCVFHRGRNMVGGWNPYV